MYLPKSWTDDRDRCRAARIPDERTFATKPDLAKAMVLRAIASPLPIAWVTADSAYGQEWRLRHMLEEIGLGYVLAVPKSQQVPHFGRIDHLFSQAPDGAWEKHSCGDGAKGPRI
ncbi:transposase [Streptomyces sp. R39]|uniref:Transposase n=1 Tax=Streptomyces sp. R39 TaxID=3238631 RepID=A0AB39R8E2_9ACTN